MSGVRSHPSVTRVGIVALAFVILGSVAQQGSTRAGPPVVPTSPPSILPTSVGDGIATIEPVRLTFERAVQPDAVAEALRIEPFAAVQLSWSDDRQQLEVAPNVRWRTDTRYVISVPGEALSAVGAPVGQAREVTFTTQTAPAVAEFLVSQAGTDLAAGWITTLKEHRFGAPADSEVLGAPASADDVSGLTQVAIRFSRAMDRAEVEQSFATSPEVEGSFSWIDQLLIFRPEGRLDPETRYSISLVGARDHLGNPLAADAVFSFTVRPEAQVVKVEPSGGASGVTPGPVTLWFSQPMDRAAFGEGFALVDLSTGATVRGELAWNAADTSVRFTPSASLARGHHYETRLDATDADGNALKGAWRFTTVAPAPAPATRSGGGPIVPIAAPSSDLAVYALNQVNAARAAYGRAPLVLDPAISAVSRSYAAYMVQSGCFGHYCNGTIHSRLANGGVSFTYAGENLCWNGSGKSHAAALEWCHAVFMSESYPPPPYNHKSNLLSSNFTRMGFGIAEGNGRIILVWDFAG